MPSLSIVVLAYNVGEYLSQCLDSVFALQLPDVEVLCVDNGSTDATLSIVADYQQRYPSLQLLHEARRGPSAVRRCGLQHASADYVFFLDGDDYLLDSTSLISVLNIARNANADLAVFNAKVNDSEYYLSSFPHVDATNAVSGPAAMAMFYAECRAIPTPTWMYLFRRNYLLSNDLFDNSFLYHSDEYYIPIYLFNAYAVCMVDIPVVNYRWHRPDAITFTTTELHLTYRRDIGRALYSYFSNRPDCSDEAMRQVFSVYIAVASDLASMHLLHRHLLSSADMHAMRQTWRIAFERKCYRLFRTAPSLLPAYMAGKLPPLLRKLINRFL